MSAKAKLSFVRISPRKARLVANEVRGKSCEEARKILRYTPKRAAKIILKVLNSAIANAAETTNYDVNTLYVEAIMVDEGPVYRRFRPRARGRVGRRRRPTSHVTIRLHGQWRRR